MVNVQRKCGFDMALFQCQLPAALKVDMKKEKNKESYEHNTYPPVLIPDKAINYTFKYWVAY